MHFRSILKPASAAWALMCSFSCAGSMDNGESDVGGLHAEIISKKREWLKGYHDDCQTCFAAFEQCERGSISDAETSACQIALDACVRGGLIDEGDGGVSESDGGLPAPGDDGAIEDDDDDADDDGQDNGNGELIDDIGVCLDNVHSCMSVPSADKRACIGALEGCVKTAVSGAFDGVCARQLSQCVKDRVSTATLEHVRNLCEEAVVP